MKILKTITDSDVGLSPGSEPISYTEYRASRAIIFDRDNKLALIHSRNKGYHKIPGGGLRQNEDTTEGLRREMREEIGCELYNIEELGIIEEFRTGASVHQLSYYYKAQVSGEKGLPQLEKDEIAEGLETLWLGLEDAINLLEKEKTTEHPEGRFINMRDLYILNILKK